MPSSNVKVKREDFTDAKDVIMREADAFGQLLKRVKEVNTTILAGWDGEAKQKFTEALYAFDSQLGNYVKLLTEYAKALPIYADDVIGVDHRGAGNISRIG